MLLDITIVIVLSLGNAMFLNFSNKVNIFYTKLLE